MPAAGGRCVPKIEKMGGRKEWRIVVVVVVPVAGVVTVGAGDWDEDGGDGDWDEADGEDCGGGHFCDPITVSGSMMMGTREEIGITIKFGINQPEFQTVVSQLEIIETDVSRLWGRSATGAQKAGCVL